MSDDYENMDIEATAFALELLMPREWVLRDSAGLDLFDDKALEKLAKRYRVTPAIMAMRIGELRR